MWKGKSVKSFEAHNNRTTLLVSGKDPARDILEKALRILFGLSLKGLKGAIMSDETQQVGAEAEAPLVNVLQNDQEEVQAEAPMPVHNDLEPQDITHTSI